MSFYIMNSYKSFDQIISQILYLKKHEIEPICKQYEKNFGTDCYYYENFRDHDDSGQRINYNLFTDMVEYICETSYIEIRFIDDKMYPSHYISTGYPPMGYMGRPYERKFTLARSKYECKRILRGIYWLLFSKRYKLTKEDRWYIRRKIWTQRVYEFEHKKKIIPDYIYEFYNMILIFDKHARR